jgi:integrase
MAISNRHRTTRCQHSLLDLPAAEGINRILEAANADFRVQNPTIREQGQIWLADLANRKRDPLQQSTLDQRAAALKNWIYPAIGHLHFSEVRNATVKPLVDALVAAGRKPWTIKTYVLILKMVVASLTDDKEEPLYIRQWRPRLLDMPRIELRKLNTPCFTSDIMSELARWKYPRERILFILAGATGARISELLGLEIGKHISPDCSTIRIEQQAYRGRVKHRTKTLTSEREIDLHPAVAALLSKYIGFRRSGFLFCTSTGRPLILPNILKYHLHPALEALGYINSVTGTHKAGTHAFRRYRETHLSKCAGLPRGLRLFWMGHGEADMSDHYDKIREDRTARKHWAERCGLGFELPPDSADKDGFKKQ